MRAIYTARPDVRSIVHAHTPSVLVFADSSVPLRPMSHMAAFIADGVTKYEIRKVPGSMGMLVNNNQLGASLAQALGGTVSGLGPQDVTPQAPTGAGGYPRSWPFWKQRAMGTNGP